MSRSRFDTFLYWLKRSSIICSLILMLLFVGCGLKKDGNDFGEKSKEVESFVEKPEEYGKDTLLKLEVYSAAENDSHIYHAGYNPSGYYGSVHKNPKTNKAINGATTFIELENAKSDDPESDNRITPEEVTYFIKYVSALPEEPVRGENISYWIWCNYIDAYGIKHYLTRYGYDEFPEDWDIFIDRYNEILGDDYLTGSGNVVAVTPEFLTELFGVTDEDVKEGTLQDVIDSQKLNIMRVTGQFYMKEVLKCYYSSLEGDILAPYQPVELIAVDSTEEEYNAFLEEYLQKLGLDMSAEVESDQGDCFRRFRINDEFEFYTARTVDLGQLPVVQSRDGWSSWHYFLRMDAHMEGMSYGQDFIYSADFKYILSPHSWGKNSDNPDIMLPFIE